GKVDLNRQSVSLHLTTEASAAAVKLTLMAHDGESGAALGSLTVEDLHANALQGGVALLANATAPDARPANQTESADAGAFWFDDWRVSGDLVERFDDRAFGPILFVHYTLSRGVMKMTAQMPPVGASDDQNVRLEIRRGGQAWEPIAQAAIDADARTA